MPCRVGITMDPDRRKEEWKLRCPSLRNWKIESMHRTRDAAQAEESRIARQRGCVSHPGGAGTENATWYVYSFDY